jgi:alanyl-tRNA synthetase
VTERLYHYNSYQITFQANIVDKYVDKGKYALILNQTRFYPTSGGQICDKGTIEEIPVIDVEEVNGEIIHYLQNELSSDIGECVSGKIDWRDRFDHMQQHTGQHILSGALMKLWQKDTQSFHMGKDICTIDIPALDIDEQKIKLIEEMTNQIIYENRSIYHYFLKNNIGLTEKKLRKKQEKLDQLRIIEIENFDRSACGGTHCQHTGEVGIIKINSWENRKDKIRISFLCGYRALADYQKKHNITSYLSHFFTTGVEQLTEKIIKLDQEQKELSKLYKKMEREAIPREVEDLKREHYYEQKGIFVIKKLFCEKNSLNLRQIAYLLSKEEKYVIILGAEQPEPVLCLACSADVKHNIKEVIEQVSQKFKGKGGGTDRVAMLKLENLKDIKSAFQIAVDYLAGQEFQ